MKFPIVFFLQQYSTDPFEINRLLVSTYLIKNNLQVRNNKTLKKYLIKETDNDAEELSNFLNIVESIDLEGLIKCFEFVISPKEKIVTGAVYTPKYIRDFIVKSVLEDIQISSKLKLADISCGCGGFLMDAAVFLHHKTKKKYAEIIGRHLFGLDIAEYSIERTKIVLSLLALKNNEDVNLQFNLFEGNALNFDLSTIGLFDIIVGNPPYICSRNIDPITKGLLNVWEVTKSGHPDLYIPFFQIAIENLKQGGLLGYITVNTFFKSLNGRSLRAYFSRNKHEFKIIDFRHERVFNNKSTYTCLCFIRKADSRFIEYTSTNSNQLNSVYLDSYVKCSYDDLDNFNGWNFGNSNIIDLISKIEGFEKKLFSDFSFSTGIATLKNDVYKFKPIKKDANYYFFFFDNKLRQVEKGICKNIINSNKVTVEEEIHSLKEKIIFPYNWSRKLKKNVLLDEAQFKQKFPFAYDYLKSNKKILLTRDKGKQDKYEKWYAYGRSQSLNCLGMKLFLPHITKEPNFVFSADSRLLFYNGEAILSNDKEALLVLKKILESSLFLHYARNTSKPYASGFFSLGKNYIKNFSLPHLDSKDKQFLLTATDRCFIDRFLFKKYKIDPSEFEKFFEKKRI